MTIDVKNQAISANLTALQALFRNMQKRLEESGDYLKESNRAAVFGTLLSIEPDLETARQVCSAMIALHRFS